MLGPPLYLMTGTESSKETGRGVRVWERTVRAGWDTIGDGSQNKIGKESERHIRMEWTYLGTCFIIK